MKKLIFGLFLTLFLSAVVAAQENRLGNQPISSSEIYQNIEKLGFLGSALFIAAHPDDENTRLIAWLDNQKMARTAYLSLTRGDGGQNLIGPELREQLGMIRTQELLEARSIDGGEQFFTRANDFGYSKDPEETLEIWERDEVLSDVVQVIRKFQPDIIINRFDHRTAGTTHGHHTSSAILSVQAFDLANDKGAFPAQLKYVNTWKPERLFFNTSWWFYGSEDAFAKADKTNLLEIDNGDYFTSTGYSVGEIAALSRSRHQSQGFGSSGSRGSSTEYLEFLKGSFPTDKSDPFSGINTTWTRVQGGQKVMAQLNKVKETYDFKDPSASLNDLLELRKQINALDSGYWRDLKLEETDLIIRDLIGLYAKATVNQPFGTSGESIKLEVELANRTIANLDYQINDNPAVNFEKSKGSVAKNKSVTIEGILNIPENEAPTNPYYLEEEGSLGMYVVDDPNKIGMPEAAAAFQIPVILMFDDQKIEMSLPVIYKTTDRVRGEIYEPFNVVPEIAISVENPVYVFGNEEMKSISVNIKAFADVSNVTVFADIPNGWIQPMVKQQPFSLSKGESRSYTFKISAPTGFSEGEMKVYVNTGDKKFDKEVVNISYNHIPDQQLVRSATAKLVNPGLSNLAQTVAYINGAGDDVATAIEAIGSKVFKFEPSEVPADLSKYDAVVVGIRAFNVEPEAMASLQNRLDTFVKNGGTLVMQYNTDRGIPNDVLGPLEISLSRKRVTDENAAVTFLDPENKVLNVPNKITQKDFEGWVQERGLYFPEKWDPAFQPILGMSDKGEAQTDGSLIVAEYGDGHVVYTGLSLFRELPVGVAGAYKLLANMISLSKTKPNLETKQDQKF
ncbi:N-acetylglucosaminyl deacetylase, LmbE family [Nonlabens sp. Hel1_33_55]|uniref:PIG-L family deacetylase n=1 Tax=Nonlabens sp. Hel1_33_55 TaxID=1336802 RepID=UPI000875BB17|nr:PIG-L family deacetylase [Nonlabens sp. Hel1_33_55]SCX96411.1 N-acetylglucosaminyl deacetylase, LmbE family [Nonlabens sp. Hel1_33_55]